MQPKVEEIRAVNAKGVEVMVYKVTPRIPAGTMDDPRATVDGLPSYQLGGGQFCNVDGNDFVIVATGERLARK